MQAVEHRPIDVPVDIVGLQVQGEAVGEEARQALDNVLAIRRCDSDLDPPALLLAWALADGVISTLPLFCDLAMTRLQVGEWITLSS
jgi:hypothetical protein